MDEKELIEIEQDVELDLRLGMLHQNWAEAILYFVKEYRKLKAEHESLVDELRHDAIERDLND